MLPENIMLILYNQYVGVLIHNLAKIRNKNGNKTRYRAFDRTVKDYGLSCGKIIP